MTKKVICFLISLSALALCYVSLHFIPELINIFIFIGAVCGITSAIIGTRNKLNKLK
jgi:hypothetical protein